MADVKNTEDAGKNTNWESIDIFVFSNGQEYSPPRKCHLTASDLEQWDIALTQLARLQYGVLHQSIDLYTLNGKKITCPLELIGGQVYVAVLPPDSFINAGYEDYLLKASRSRERRQAKNGTTTNIDSSNNNNIKQVDSFDNKSKSSPVNNLLRRLEEGLIIESDENVPHKPDEIGATELQSLTETSVNYTKITTDEDDIFIKTVKTEVRSIDEQYEITVKPRIPEEIPKKVTSKPGSNISRLDRMKYVRNIPKKTFNTFVVSTDAQSKSTGDTPIHPPIRPKSPLIKRPINKTKDLVLDKSKGNTKNNNLVTNKTNAKMPCCSRVKPANKHVSHENKTGVEVKSSSGSRNLSKNVNNEVIASAKGERLVKNESQSTMMELIEVNQDQQKSVLKVFKDTSPDSTNIILLNAGKNGYNTNTSKKINTLAKQLSKERVVAFINNSDLVNVKFQIEVKKPNNADNKSDPNILAIKNSDRSEQQRIDPYLQGLSKEDQVSRTTSTHSHTIFIQYPDGKQYKLEEMFKDEKITKDGKKYLVLMPFEVPLEKEKSNTKDTKSISVPETILSEKRPSKSEEQYKDIEKKDSKMINEDNSKLISHNYDTTPMHEDASKECGSECSKNKFENQYAVLKNSSSQLILSDEQPTKEQTYSYTLPLKLSKESPTLLPGMQDNPEIIVTTNNTNVQQPRADKTHPEKNDSEKVIYEPLLLRRGDPTHLPEINERRKSLGAFTIVEPLNKEPISGRNLIEETEGYIIDGYFIPKSELVDPNKETQFNIPETKENKTTDDGNIKKEGTDSSKPIPSTFPELSEKFLKAKEQQSYQKPMDLDDSFSESQTNNRKKSSVKSDQNLSEHKPEELNKTRIPDPDTFSKASRQSADLEKKQLKSKQYLKTGPGVNEMKGKPDGYEKPLEEQTYLNQAKIDKSVQTDHLVCLEVRKEKDGHYSFHIPPIKMLKKYKILVNKNANT